MTTMGDFTDADGGSMGAMTTTQPFSDAELAEMALNHLIALVDQTPNSMADAWKPLETWFIDADLDAHNDAKRKFGATSKAAVEVTTEVAALAQERDGAKIKGLVTISALILGLVAPGSREDVRKVLKGLPKTRPTGHD